MTGVVASADLTRAHGTSQSLGWWVMVCLIITEAALFVVLLSTYVYVGTNSAQWPPRQPEVALPFLNTIILLISSGTAWRADARHQTSGHGGLGWLGATLALGLLFLFLQGYEYAGADFGASADAHASLFYTITAFHGAHVFIGLGMLAVTTLWIWQGRNARRRMSVNLALMYWHFVDVVWLFVFTTLYLAPRL